METILDVGANRGQFSRCCLESFPHVEVHAFEPLPLCQADLAALKRDHPNLRVHSVALGDEAGIVEMTESRFSPASSLLSMEPRLRELWPHTSTGNRIKVQVTTLDSIAETWVFGSPIFLKIDVQGFELHVLRGAESVLPDVRAAMLEVAFEPLYKGQPECIDVFEFLARYGLRFVGFVEEEKVPPHMSLIFGDALFLRS